MPELPEVEGVRHYLDPLLAGRTVLSAEVIRPKIIARPDAAAFCEAVTGRTFAGVGRRAKFLLLRLKDGGTVILHLRMTGLPLVVPAAAPREKHTHVIFHLDGDDDLRYIDYRQFGRFWLLEPGETDDFTGMAKLGPEPLTRAFGPKTLEKALVNRKAPIKACLLDQTVVAGLGNIYADEVLFAAGVRPDRAADALTAAETARIARCTKKILTAAVAKDRMTRTEYEAQHGAERRDAERLNVYGRKGQPCVQCGTPLLRITVGQRSSYFCPKCQH